MDRQVSVVWRLCGILMCAMLLAGCADKHEAEDRPISMTIETTEEAEGEKSGASQEVSEALSDVDADEGKEPETVSADWSEYFNGLNGAAVLYDVSNLRYTVYNGELAAERRSPCSTFKIISSLIALEHGIIVPDHSTRAWSGETFWNEAWNQDIDFTEAFRSSCVWYFREVIDDIGQELMQEELDRLQYGNCDISDWEGRLNTNNNNRALTGFWVESSLTISPKEQVEVMERIFGSESAYSEEARAELKRVMLAEEQALTEFSIYGKTGMGKAHGETVDAWYTGLAEGAGETVYFCVYLGRTEGGEVTSAAAREIAMQILSNWKN